MLVVMIIFFNSIQMKQNESPKNEAIFKQGTAIYIYLPNPSAMNKM